MSFIRESKRPLLDPKSRVQRLAPDLAIEIVSAKDSFEKLVRRAQRFRDCGTEEAWIFSLENRQAFLSSEKRLAIPDENGEFCPRPIPGLVISIGDLLDQYY